MRIENGREHFYQWDINQRLLVEDNDVIEVHFYNAISTNALVCAVYEDSGNRVVNVPNILLQEHFDIKACGCCAECVRVAEIFTVEARKKPDDYIYTETEIKRYEDLESRIEYLEKNGTGGGVGIESVIQTNEDGGYNIVNFTDGNKLEVKNGETGKTGRQGESVRITSIMETQEGNTVNFSDGNSMFVANGSAGNAPVKSVNGQTGDVKVNYLAYGNTGGATESRIEMALASGRTPYFRIIGGNGGEYEGQEFSMYYQTTDEALYGRYKRADGNIFFDKVYTDRNPQPITADNIASALGYVPEEKSGVYELINTITLEGGESAVDITEDSNKNAFALKAAFVKVEMPASSDSGTGYIETYYEEQRISKHHLSNIKQSASAPKTAKAEVTQRYGRWVEHTYGAAAEGATANMLNIVQFVLEATTEELKHIDKIKVRVTGNIIFDAGTKITVWGVRANSNSGGNTEPIRITKQPVDITIAANNTVTFSVEAEGNGLTYQWEYLTLTGSAWKNNTQEGNTTATLTFKAQDYHNGYKYRCLITDAAGNTLRTNEVVLAIGATSA